MPPARPTLTTIRGVRVGHATAPDGRTGVTVLRFEAPAATVVDVRGGASATYDTASLSLESTFGRRWALFFSGGSLFGLDAASGVRSRILEEGGGLPVFRSRRRIAQVSGAALFDLPRGSAPLPDYRALGYSAAASASRAAVASGRVGAGAGATVGKYHGRRYAAPGGVGSAATKVPRVGWVGVLAAANSVGAIRDPETGAWLAGGRGTSRGKSIVSSPGTTPSRQLGTNLVAVVTDAGITRSELARVAVLAQTGLARAVVPVNTATDGDVVFASTTGAVTAPKSRRPGERADALGIAAAELVARALAAAVGVA